MNKIANRKFKLLLSSLSRPRLMINFANFDRIDFDIFYMRFDVDLRLQRDRESTIEKSAFASAKPLVIITIIANFSNVT